MSRELGCMMFKGLLWAGVAQALPSYPLPLNTHDPAYPKSMLRSSPKKIIRIR
ncbi:energy transducer TonB, partial [Pseudomonas syringae pv. tagetis]